MFACVWFERWLLGFLSVGAKSQNDDAKHASPCPHTPTHGTVQRQDREAVNLYERIRAIGQRQTAHLRASEEKKGYFTCTRKRVCFRIRFLEPNAFCRMVIPGDVHTTLHSNAIHRLADDNGIAVPIQMIADFLFNYSGKHFWPDCITE